MLLEMHIKDLAIIDQAYFEFDKGLNIFTGETGTGKTLVVTAMNMLLGDRADTTLVRSGCARASIEGLFSLQEEHKSIVTLMEVSACLSEDLVITRELLQDGKSKCYVNGKLVSVNQLAAAGEELVDLHGQHEHQSLLKPHTHVLYLDEFGSDDLLQIKSKYEEIYTDLAAKKRKFQQLSRSEQENLRKEDLLKFQINEIEDANLVIGEDCELEKHRQILIHSEKLHLAANSCLSLIAGRDESQFSALDSLREAVEKLHQAKGIDQELDDICNSCESLVYTTEDFAQTVREYQDQIEFEPALLDEVEARLSIIALLKKKYGDCIELILEYKAKAQAELECLADSDEEMACLKVDIAQEEKILAQLASELNDKRNKYASVLRGEVEKQLSELNMPKVKFEIRVSQQADEAGVQVGDRLVKPFPDGADKVDFLIATNPGEPLKPLNKIVSGGELSRILLALKIALAKVDSIFTLIFDEIDSGIGGKTAFTVGHKLAQLAQNHQVICITHLPQIASFADRHFCISKREKDKRTLTSVELLDHESRRIEIARMLSGERVSELSIKHAAEIIKKAGNLKEKMQKGRYAAV